jgi:hypothetical protein
MSDKKFQRNDPCPCGSGKKIKNCCFIFKGINAIGDDSYFIRLKDNKDTYVHYESQDSKNMTYRLKEGLNGAAGWHKKEGENFILESGADNLELVKISDILGKNDGSLN